MTARAAWQVAPGRGRGWGLFGVGLGLLVGCSSGFDPQRVVLLGMVNPQGVVLVVSLIFVAVNVLVDLCYAVLDPRIRTEAA